MKRTRLLADLFYERLGDDGEVEIELPVGDLHVVHVQALPEQALELLLTLLNSDLQFLYWNCTQRFNAMLFTIINTQLTTVR